MDVGQPASVTAGRTATYKLRARPILMEYDDLSNGCKIDHEAMKLASLLSFGHAA
jgi:hypothetical protein